MKWKLQPSTNFDKIEPTFRYLYDSQSQFTSQLSPPDEDLKKKNGSRLSILANAIHDLD